MCGVLTVIALRQELQLTSAPPTLGYNTGVLEGPAITSVWNCHRVTLPHKQVQLMNIAH
jgi:hypothetical protein